MFGVLLRTLLFGEWPLCGKSSRVALASHTRFSFPPNSHLPMRSSVHAGHTAALHMTSKWRTIRQRPIPLQDVQWC